MISRRSLFGFTLAPVAPLSPPTKTLEEWLKLAGYEKRHCTRTVRCGPPRPDGTSNANDDIIAHEECWFKEVGRDYPL